MSLIDRYRQTLERFLIASRRSLLVACSGGGDSVALAAFSAKVAPELDLEVTLMHCDHGLREGSAAEADFVRELGARLGLKVRCEKLALPASGNREAVARRARYTALEATAVQLRGDAVLTGHTAEDRAETLWLWLLRGTGPAGLAPLPAERPLSPGGTIRLLRPLLEFRREDLRSSLREAGIPWLEDPSNADLSLRRNRVRHRLLPFLDAEFGLDPTVGAGRLADRMTELLDYLDAELAARDLDPLAPRHARAQLATLPAALARHFAHRLCRNQEAVERLVDFIARKDSGCVLHLPGARRARLEAEHLIIESLAATAIAPPGIPQTPLPAAGLPLPPDLPAILALPGNWQLRLRRSEGRTALPETHFSALFDTDALAGPLRLANPEPGMRIRLLGGPGRGKLSDLFIDRKVPRPYRAAWPILLDSGKQVLWVPGLARSEIAAREPNTRQCLCLDLEPGSA